ncbi:molybdenum cofactor guanylyltransferase [Georgenia alba]|uniref:Molybdenum cofactor guanylyltransferase n=1 Tax=Georgenia alba TaxID=2233858 RepID=A0ABW2Q7E8_9MICO
MSGQPAAGGPTSTFDAVILAGGRADRLGGASKPDVVLEGRRLLDHTLAATTEATRVVVVAPEEVSVPDGVRRTLESPRYGGPVAGLAAGLEALPPDADLVLVLACDVPRAAPAVPRLVAAAESHDGAVLIDATGQPQWLTAVYRAGVLRRRLAVRTGGALHALVAGLDLAEVPAQGREAEDVDTWDDVGSD